MLKKEVTVFLFAEWIEWRKHVQSTKQDDQFEHAHSPVWDVPTFMLCLSIIL